MGFGIKFFLKSVLLGVGLSMDAFSVSLANGLNEPDMPKRKFFLIAGVFAFFQALMPLIGWICVHTVAEHFKIFEKIIPYIALILLGFIGGKMVFEFLKDYKRKPKKESIEDSSQKKNNVNNLMDVKIDTEKNNGENKEKEDADCCVTTQDENKNKPIKLTLGTLLIQGIATSIDALSVGFTISDYNLLMALVCAFIIAVITFCICFSGIFLGKKFGTLFAGKATLIGGLILIAIGIEIFISGIV